MRGNVITCQDHIPGSLLLPHIARCLEKAKLANVWQRIASGDIRVLPSTPEIDDERSLPVPMCWEEPKEKGGKSWRLTHGADENDKTQYKPVRMGFVMAQKRVLQRSILKVLRTHNTVEDEKQRPGEAVGGVYTYEALATGQIFRSEVWIRGNLADDEKGTVETALHDEGARVGRARHAGYGHVRISKPEKNETSPTGEDTPDTLSVWLTSDAILPAGTWNSGLEALAEAVVTATGCAIDIFDFSKSWSNLRWRRIDGWQSRWGLPRPTLTALQAGSVAIFALKGGVKLDIERLEHEGIGERRGEGFGCVLVNHAYLREQPNDVKTINPKPIKTSAAARVTATYSQFLETVCRRAWERCIALRAEIATTDVTDRKKLLCWKLADGNPEPNMSQLGALRAVMDELLETDAPRVADWITHLKTIDTRADKWPEGALNKIKQLMREPHAIWAELGLNNEQDDARFVGAPRPEELPGNNYLKDKRLQLFAIRTLLLKAIRAHKRASEKKSEEPREAVA